MLYLLYRREATLGVDYLADTEDLNSCGRRQLDVLDLLSRQPVLKLIFRLLLLLDLRSHLVALVHDQAHLPSGFLICLVLLVDGVYVEVQAEELGKRLLAHHSLSLQVTLLDVLRGQAVRPIQKVKSACYRLCS